MNDLIGKAFSLIAIHLAGFALFWLLWTFIITQMYEMPSLNLVEVASLYLIVDVLFFIIEGVK